MYQKFSKAVFDYLGHLPDSDTRIALTKSLSAQWKREGWTWSHTCAVKLEKDEDVIFHQNGLTILRSSNLLSPGEIYLHPVKFGQYHPRVIWFK
jgi:hypothetical protein